MRVGLLLVCLVLGGVLSGGSLPAQEILSVCEVRADRNGDGWPDLLGEYVRVRGTVSVAPGTFDSGGFLFWVQDRTGGVLAYGEPETFSLGDVVEIEGEVRVTNGNYFFPDTGIATLGDVAIENCGAWLTAEASPVRPAVIDPTRLIGFERPLAGRVVASGPFHIGIWPPPGEDGFVAAWSGGETLRVYVDGDAGLPGIGSGGRVFLTGVIVGMSYPPSYPYPTWCLAPRVSSDVIPVWEPQADCGPTSWGFIKNLFSGGARGQ